MGITQGPDGALWFTESAGQPHRPDHHRGADHRVHDPDGERRRARDRHRPRRRAVVHRGGRRQDRAPRAPAAAPARSPTARVVASSTTPQRRPPRRASTRSTSVAGTGAHHEVRLRLRRLGPLRQATLPGQRRRSPTRCFDSPGSHVIVGVRVTDSAGRTGDDARRRSTAVRTERGVVATQGRQPRSRRDQPVLVRRPLGDLARASLGYLPEALHLGRPRGRRRRHPGRRARPAPAARPGQRAARSAAIQVSARTRRRSADRQLTCSTTTEQDPERRTASRGCSASGRRSCASTPRRCVAPNGIERAERADEALRLPRRPRRCPGSPLLSQTGPARRSRSARRSPRTRCASATARSTARCPAFTFTLPKELGRRRGERRDGWRCRSSSARGSTRQCDTLDVQARPAGRLRRLPVLQHRPADRADGRHDRASGDAGACPSPASVFDAAGERHAHRGPRLALPGDGRHHADHELQGR